MVATSSSSILDKFASLVLTTTKKTANPRLMESNTNAEATDAEAPLPSCDGCRVRKLKCSRQRPSCSNCQRLDEPCFYDSVRNRPGLKSGTVDKLHRRIDVLERSLLRHDQQNGTSTRLATGSTAREPADERSDSAVPGMAAFSMLATEMGKLSSSISLLSRSLPTNLESSAPLSEPTADNNNCGGKRKRPITDETERTRRGNPPYGRSETFDASTRFFAGRNLEDLLDVYFDNIHPWIPMIHTASFRKKLQGLHERSERPLLLHAILAASLRILNATGDYLSVDHTEQYIEQSMKEVIIQATGSLTVESLQALTIIAFMHIENGEPLRALPLVASLTRTAEYLQLSVEEGDIQKPATFFRPRPLPPPSDCMELEERRRIFWNIFILDRMCSMLTGWNIGLTAANVSRRLPLCGALWHGGSPALSPYFGVWDSSAAKISNSLVFLPGQYPSPEQSVESSLPDFEGGQRPQTPRSQIDTSIIGAFAYYIESLESLCRINMYFINQTIDFSNRQEVSCWLTRFKELDLRLIHWKTFLPVKWKDPDVPPEATTALDPNMSLAHITHNTSMILLHQRIGYPEPQLQHIKLPSFYSAETCLSAAIETANIMSNYLSRAPERMPLSPHFSFCGYISARVLLIHSQYYGVTLDAKFAILLDCLHETSRRWLHPLQQSSTPTLSAQFATHLETLRERCLDDPTFTPNLIGSIDSIERGVVQVANQPSLDSLQAPQSQYGTNQSAEPRLPAAAISTQSGALPTVQQPTSIGGNSFQAGSSTDSFRGSYDEHWKPASNAPDVGLSGDFTGPPDELFNILQTLTDDSFAEMDRVISFDDFNLELI